MDKYSNKAVSFAVHIIDDLDNLDPTAYAIEHMLTHKLQYFNYTAIINCLDKQGCITFSM